MRKISRTWLYIIFFSPLAFFYEPIKKYFDDGWLFSAAVFTYLCICSVLAYYLGKPDD